jgi:hypothetical protein
LSDAYDMPVNALPRVARPVNAEHFSRCSAHRSLFQSNSERDSMVVERMSATSARIP